MADSLTDPVCLEDFESYARQYLPNHAFEFFAGGANEETTIRENVEAFKRCENIQNGRFDCESFRQSSVRQRLMSVLPRSETSVLSAMIQKSVMRMYIPRSFSHRRKQLGNPVRRRGGGGGWGRLLPYISYIGMCRPISQVS